MTSIRDRNMNNLKHLNTAEKHNNGNLLKRSGFSVLADFVADSVFLHQ